MWSKIGLAITRALNLNPGSVYLMTDYGPQFSHLLNWTVKHGHVRGSLAE